MPELIIVVDDDEKFVRLYQEFRAARLLEDGGHAGVGEIAQRIGADLAEQIDAIKD